MAARPGEKNLDGTRRDWYGIFSPPSLSPFYAFLMRREEALPFLSSSSFLA